MMNSQLKVFGITTVLLLGQMTPFAYAGPSDGGGGNALVCFKDIATADQVRSAGHRVSNDLIQGDHIISIESVDLHEALLPQGIDGTKPELIPFSQGMLASTYLEKVATRFDSSVPRLGSFIRVGKTAFDGGNTRFDDNPIDFINDADLSTDLDHDNCTLVTLARQEQTQGTWILRIDGRLYHHPAHTDWSRAVLILHEVLYRTARENGQTNSRNTRLLLGAMLNQNDGRTVWSLIQFASSMGFLKLDVSETFLEQFRISLGLLAIQSAWGAYQNYVVANPGNEIISLLQKAGITTDTIIDGAGHTVSRDLSDGNYYLFFEPASGFTDDQKALLAQARTLYAKYNLDRKSFVGDAVQKYAANVLVPMILSTVPNDVPADDIRVLENAVAESYAPASYYATGFYFYPVAPGIIIEGAGNALHLLAHGSDFGEQLVSNKVQLWENFKTSSFTLTGSTWSFRSSIENPKGINDSGNGIEIDLTKVGSVTAGFNLFSNPSVEFQYPLPTLK